MENKHTIIVELEQHTPMWHFQSQESGCCLRASEVKPKLDRFITERLKKEGPFNYKMSFIAIGKPQSIKVSGTNAKGKPINLFPLYFGNIGGNTASEENLKKLIFHPKGIEMRLFSFDGELLKNISKYLDEFFARTSFGTRQDKGFGFFYPKGKNKEFNAATYFFETPSDVDSFPELFKYIHYFHKMIRSGINEGRAYYKSFMFHYAKEKGEKWDKPIIRHYFQLYNSVYKNTCGEPNNLPDKLKEKFPQRVDMKNEYAELQTSRSRWLFREALGLSNTQSWMAYNDVITIKSDNDSIKRFKSPITYRPVPMDEGGYRVYLYLSPINQNYKDTTFSISHQPKYGYKKTSMLNMKIYDNFSLEEYLDFVIGHCCSDQTIIGNDLNRYADHIFKKQKNGEINFKKISKSE